MEAKLYNISQVLGITVIHSLWQGLLIYFLLRLALLAGNRLPASRKYVWAVAALSVSTIWFFYTLITEISLYNWITVTPAKISDMPLMLELPMGMHQLDEPVTRHYYSIEQYLPYIAALYIAGLLANTGRLILARNKISAIKRTMVVDDTAQTQVDKFATLFNIGITIKTGLSKLVDVPCVTGYFKPVILLPFTLSTYLSAQEVEAILLHELAHIKRNDYLVNVIQQVISILLFFNPFTHLINRIISDERENCCDDLVVNTTGNPMIYARALLKLEENRRENWQLALAATGKRYNLLNRIERIMKTKTPAPNMRPVLIAMFALTITIGCVALLKPEIAQGKISVKAVKPALDKIIAAAKPIEAVEAIQDTTPKKLNKNADTALKAKTADTTKQDNSNAYQLFGYNDAKMDSLWKEYRKHSNFVNGYFKTSTYKELKRKLNGDESDTFYDNDTLKHFLATIKQISKHVTEYYGTSDGRLKDIELEQESLGLKVGAYYSGDDFKKLNSQLQQKYGVVKGKDYSSGQDANYQKYQAELKSNMPASVRAEIKRLEDVREQMAREFASADFKTSIRRIHEISDSLKEYQTKQHVKQHEPDTKLPASNLSAEERTAYFNQIQAYSDSPEYKNEMQLLRQSMDKMRDYMNTPEFLQHAKDWQNHLQTAMGNDFEVIANPDRNIGK